MSMFRRVLVTGGAGFIGSHLVDRLLSDGFEVVVVDDLSTGRIANVKWHFGAAGFSFVKADIRDRAVVGEVLRDVDAVFHLAAITSVPFSVRFPQVTREVNVGGTRNLLEACLARDVARFVFISSCAVYGEPEYLPLDEKHPTVPISPYAESKLEAEGLCRIFSEEYGLKVVMLRFFNVYGLGMRADQYGGVITQFIKRLRVGEAPVIYGDGEQTRDFVYVGDVVQAMLLALGGADVFGRVFNIGCGVPVTINQLADVLIGLTGAGGVKPIYRGARAGDIRHSYADIRLAKDVLGFEPRFPLKEGLARLLSGNVG